MPEYPMTPDTAFTTPYLRRRTDFDFPALGLWLDVSRSGHHGRRRLLRRVFAGAGAELVRTPFADDGPDHRPARARGRAVASACRRWPPGTGAGALHRLLGAHRRDHLVRPARLHRVQSVASTFTISAAMFGAMALYRHRDAAQPGRMGSVPVHGPGRRGASRRSSACSGRTTASSSCSASSA